MFIHFVNAEKKTKQPFFIQRYSTDLPAIIQLAANAIASIACYVLMKDNSKWPNPTGSMYGLFTYIYPTNQLNVDRYTIHGNSGDYPIIIKNNIQLYIYICTRMSSWWMTKGLREGLVSHPNIEPTTQKCRSNGIWGYVMVPIEGWGWSNLEDHPRTCKWLMTMISKSPKDPVVALTNGWIFVFIHSVNA